MTPYIIAVDFDGTLCENAWPGIGEPKTDLIEYLISVKKIGHKIILWTCRADERLDAAINWCKDLGLEFDAVNENLPEVIKEFGHDTRKIFAHEYIDDRANPLRLFGLTRNLPFKTQKIKQSK